MKENGLDLKLINPRLDEKFSLNLLLFLRAHRNRPIKNYGTAYLDGKETLWLGYLAKDNWFVGCQLMQVLCSGARARGGTFNPRICESFEEVPNFWETYVRIGRCAIDTKHNRAFLNADNRYKVSADGNERVCQWCGKVQKLHRWQETVEHSKWVNAEEMAK